MATKLANVTIMRCSSRWSVEPVVGLFWHYMLLTLDKVWEEKLRVENGWLICHINVGNIQMKEEIVKM